MYAFIASQKPRVYMLISRGGAVVLHGPELPSDAGTAAGWDEDCVVSFQELDVEQCKGRGTEWPEARVVVIPVKNTAVSLFETW